MKKSIILVCLLTSFTLTSFSQYKDPVKNIKAILELSQYKSLTKANYDKINQLIQECPKAIDQSLEENGATYLFKMELLDAVHKDAFYEFGDTLALQRRVMICKWAEDNYPEESNERKAADSKLIETYTLWKKFDQARTILKNNLKSAQFPSLDHANCKYTEGWFYTEMGNTDKAKICLEEALDEFHELKEMGYAGMTEPQITDEQFAIIYKGVQEAKRGIEDCQGLLNGLSN